MKNDMSDLLMVTQAKTDETPSSSCLVWCSRPNKKKLGSTTATGIKALMSNVSIDIWPL
jgi:hypothetical protein